jgi:hypothetical protein
MSQESEIRRHIAEQNRQKEVVELTRKLIDATNVMGGDKLVAAGIADGIMGSHRTLQQSFMRCFVMAMKEYGETEFKDPRNQDAVALAKKIGEIEAHLSFI